MIPIRDFHTICQELIDSIEGLDHFHLVADDNQATKKLGSQSGIHMVAVIPSAEGTGQPGRTIDNNVALFFVVQKPKASAKDEEELTLYEDTQIIMEGLKQELIQRQEDGCTVFFRLEPSSIQIDPVYNTFGGWSGWSMSLVF